MTFLGSSRRAALALVIGAAATLGGCGLGAGEQADAVHLRVTDDFGAKVLAEPAEPKQAGADTVMRLLQRNAKVETRYGGGFVQSINGLSGQADAGEQIDWFFYVNGLLAGRGAASWRVAEGERIWWDRHRWDLAQIDAVVGDYPQPMQDGHDGKYAGAQLDCRSTEAVCSKARTRLRDGGIAVNEGEAAKAGARTRVVVGPWSAIRTAAPELEQLADGPAESGVFAKVGKDGSIAGLDAAGRPVARAAIGDRTASLVAAMKPTDASPLWVITGATDEAVQWGVGTLTPDTLGGRAAVIAERGRAFALPLRPGDEGRPFPR